MDRTTLEKLKVEVLDKADNAYKTVIYAAKAAAVAANANAAANAAANATKAAKAYKAADAAKVADKAAAKAAANAATVNAADNAKAYKADAADAADAARIVADAAKVYADAFLEFEKQEQAEKKAREGMESEEGAKKETVAEAVEEYHSPPKRAELMWYWVLPPDEYENVGDLCEAYNKIYQCRGRRSANRFFWWQTVRAVSSKIMQSVSQTVIQAIVKSIGS